MLSLGNNIIQNVIISNSVEEIGASAFADCTELASVSFGDNVEMIKTSAFENCNNISYLELPSSLGTIEEKAFANLPLDIVTINGLNVQIDNNAFENNDSFILQGLENSTSKSFADNNSLEFKTMSTPVQKLEIVTQANIKEFDINGTIDTTGLSLKVTYIDGTSETITEGFMALLDKKVGDTIVTVFYKNGTTTYPVTLTSEYILADFDGNNEIEAYDAYLVLRFVASGEISTEEQLARGDVNRDGKIEAYDAYLILRYVAGAITEF